jgi:hypothetical protein
MQSIRYQQVNHLSKKSKDQEALADLTVLAFFFLLRVGEYTPSLATA